MINFTKDKNTFMRFALEILASNSTLSGVDYKQWIQKGHTLYQSTSLCSTFEVRGESKLSKLLKKTGRSSTDKQQTLSDILEAMDIEDFNVKLSTNETASPNGYNWLFGKHNKSHFIESIKHNPNSQGKVLQYWFVLPK